MQSTDHPTFIANMGGLTGNVMQGVASMMSLSLPIYATFISNMGSLASGVAQGVARTFSEGLPVFYDVQSDVYVNAYLDASNNALWLGTTDAAGNVVQPPVAFVENCSVGDAQVPDTASRIGTVECSGGSSFKLAIACDGSTSSEINTYTVTMENGMIVGTSLVPEVTCSNVLTGNCNQQERIVDLKAKGLVGCDNIVAALDSVDAWSPDIYPHCVSLISIDNTKCTAKDLGSDSATYTDPHIALIDPDGAGPQMPVLSMVHNPDNIGSTKSCCDVKTFEINADGSATKITQAKFSSPSEGLGSLDFAAVGNGQGAWTVTNGTAGPNGQLWSRTGMISDGNMQHPASEWSKYSDEITQPVYKTANYQGDDGNQYFMHRSEGTQATAVVGIGQAATSEAIDGLGDFPTYAVGVGRIPDGLCGVLPGHSCTDSSAAPSLAASTTQSSIVTTTEPGTSAPQSTTRGALDTTTHPMATTSSLVGTGSTPVTSEPATTGSSAAVTTSHVAGSSTAMSSAWRSSALPTTGTISQSRGTSSLYYSSGTTASNSTTVAQLGGGNSGLGSAEIAGIAMGVFGFLALIAVAVIFLYKFFFNSNAVTHLSPRRSGGDTSRSSRDTELSARSCPVGNFTVVDGPEQSTSVVPVGAFGGASRKQQNYRSEEDEFYDELRGWELPRGGAHMPGRVTSVTIEFGNGRRKTTTKFDVPNTQKDNTNHVIITDLDEENADYPSSVVAKCTTGAANSKAL